MYKNRPEGGGNNISGINIRKLRLSLHSQPSQREFAEMLQRAGLDLDKNAVQRIESGQRFVTDVELKVIARVLCVTCDALLVEEGDDLLNEDMLW